MDYSLYPLGDTAVVVCFGQTIDETTHSKVKILAHYLETKPFAGFIDMVPAFTSITIFYDPICCLESTSKLKGQVRTPYQVVCQIIDETIARMDLDSMLINASRIIEIPVCYGEVYGPDLDFVAKYNKLNLDEVVAIHSEGQYLVYMLGFAPGFPYLGGMSTQIATPRKSSPRPVIPAGSVGIAGQQTGVYSIETPGGWQIIGRTPLKLFQPSLATPSLLRVGDQIRFIPISDKEFKHLEEGQA